MISELWSGHDFQKKITKGHNSADLLASGYVEGLL